MLQIKNLTITHKKDLRTLVENLSFVLEPGDKMAVIGEEGNGKSTLLKLIWQEETAGAYIEYEGEIQKQGLSMGYLAQELTQEEKALTVWEFCCQNPAFYQQSPKELANAANKLGISSELFYAQEEMGQLSGGEKIKIQLALLLLQNPEVILLDEPSNDLDLEALGFLEVFLQTTQAAVLYVSHDETLLERTANKILHLELLKHKTSSRYTLAKCGYEEYLEKRTQGFQKQQKLACKQREEYQKQQERFMKIQQTVEHQQNSISRQDPHGGRLLKKKMHAIKSMEKRFERQKEDLLDFPETEEAIFFLFQKNCKIHAGKSVLEYEQKVLKIEERMLARGLFLRIQGPERVGIVGKNGCGKTTLLREIVKNLEARQDIKIAYMPQNYEDRMDLDQTCIAFLQISGDREEEEKIRTYLGSMKYTREEMEHPMRALSGGQKAKLFFLKMSMQGSQVLILDEPTRNFSPLSNPVIRSMLAKFPGALISISHDRKYLEEVCTAVYELTENGLKKR